MKYPIRSETHKIEAAAWRLLHEIAPEEWIVREVSERDYGIDSYIELATPTGDVTGNLILVQLKGVKKLTWKKSKEGITTASSPRIKTGTANYWFNLPVPVFLFVADLSSHKIYYASVKNSIRSQFGKLSKQDWITFKLIDELNIKSQFGTAIFNWLIARERTYDQFAFHITNLLSHVPTFGDFIAENQNRDSFMEVESGRHLQFRALYDTCCMASLYLEKAWEIEPLKDFYIKDRDQWKDDFVLLHEGTLDYVLRKLESTFVRLVRRAVTLVAKEQGDYWRWRDPVFYRLCSSGELEWTIKHVEHQLGLT